MPKNFKNCQKNSKTYLNLRKKFCGTSFFSIAHSAGPIQNVSKKNHPKGIFSKRYFDRVTRQIFAKNFKNSKKISKIAKIIQKQPKFAKDADIFEMKKKFA